MKFFYLSLCLLFFSCSKSRREVKACRYNEGIKTAVISATIQEEDEMQKDAFGGTQTIHYNASGQELKIEYSNDTLLVHKRVYHDGKLKFIINTRKKNAPSLDSSQQNTSIHNNFISDTTIVLAYHSDGRPIKMKQNDWTLVNYSYTACDQEVQTLIDNEGDTLHQLYYYRENDVLVKTTWIPFIPVKSMISTNYFDYKYDGNGYWISRKYDTRNHTIVTEMRSLVYY